VQAGANHRGLFGKVSIGSTPYNDRCPPKRCYDHKPWHLNGLKSFNPRRVLARFAQKEEGPSSASDSTSSVLSASDWRKIERLLRQVVADTYDKGSRQLS
jgi:hypothetical protein